MTDRPSCGKSALPQGKQWQGLRRGVIAAFVVIFCAVLVGAVSRDRDPIELDLFTVRKTGVSLDMHQDGIVEPLFSDRVKSASHWRVRILSLVPEGTWVQKGDIVCELDSSEIHEFLRTREVYLIRARAALDNSVQEEELTRSRNERRISQARFAHSAAEMQYDEFVNGTMPQRLEALENNLAIYGDELAAAQEAFEEEERLWSRGLVNSRRLDTASFTLLQQQLKYDRLLGSMVTLKEFTNPRSELRLSFAQNETQRNVLRTEISNSLYSTKARLNTLADERRMQIYQRYVDLAQDSIDACTLRAPRDGRVMYCNSWYLQSRGIRPIEEGKTVYLRQPVFEIPSEKHMKVSVPLPEALITRVSIGARVNVHLEGFPDDHIAGEVIDISDYPLARSSYTPGLREYMLDVALQPTEDQRQILQPRMNAKVSINLLTDNSAIMIPQEAVVGSVGRNFVWLMRERDLVACAVDLGEVVNGQVVVEHGLHEGDRIAISLTPQLKNSLQLEVDAALAASSH